MPQTVVSRKISPQCTLPDCFCSSDGTLVPGGLSPKDIPQMVIITFDDAVNDENWDLYAQKLFPQEGNSIAEQSLWAIFWPILRLAVQ